MSQPQERSNAPRYPRRNLEEDRAWIHVYRDANDPSVAAEVVKHLESDDELKRAHTALYLRCKQAVRRQKLVEERNKRIGSFMRLVITAVVFGPFRAMRSMWSAGTDIAVEVLPEARREPATPRVQRLQKEPEFAHAKSTFPAQPTDTPVAAESQAGGSRSARAA